MIMLKGVACKSRMEFGSSVNIPVVLLVCVMSVITLTLVRGDLFRY